MKAVEQLEYTIEEWDDEDQRIVEVLARVANALPASAAYEQFRERRPKRIIRLRDGARIVRDSTRPG